MLSFLKTILDWVVDKLLRRRFIVMAVIRHFVGNRESLRELITRRKAVADFGSDPEFMTNLLQNPDAFDNVVAFVASNPEALHALLMSPEILRSLGAQAEFVDMLSADERVLGRIVTGTTFMAGLVAEGPDANDGLLARMLREPPVFEAVLSFFARNPEALTLLLEAPATLTALSAQGGILRHIAGTPTLMRHVMASPALAETLTVPPADGDDPLGLLLAHPSTLRRVLDLVVGDDVRRDALMSRPDLVPRLATHDRVISHICADDTLVERVAVGASDFARHLLARDDAAEIVAALATDLAFVAALLARALPRLAAPPPDVSPGLEATLDTLGDLRLAAGGAEPSIRLLARHPNVAREVLADLRLRDAVADAALRDGIANLFAQTLTRPSDGADVPARALSALGAILATPAFVRALAGDEAFRGDLLRLLLGTLRDVGADPVADLIGPLAEVVASDRTALAVCVADLPTAADRERFLRAAEAGRRMAEAKAWLDPSAAEAGRRFLARPNVAIDFDRLFAALSAEGAVSLRDGGLRVAGGVAAGADFRDLFLDELLHVEAGAAAHVVDGACGSGLSLGYLKARHPEASIIAFEPNPALFEIAAANVARLGCSGIDLRDGGLAATNATVTAPSGATVTTWALADLLVRPIDLLRLGPDDAALVALLGVGERIRAVRHLVCALPGGDVAAQARLTDLLVLLGDNGFEFHVHRHDDDGRRPLAHFGRPIAYSVAARNRRPE